MKLRIKRHLGIYTLFSGLLVLSSLIPIRYVSAVTQTQQSAGVQGQVTAPAPTVPATVTTPSQGQVFTSTPITVSGLCKGDVLVSVFKNGVFGGSVQCKNGSYSLQVDLFSGTNEIVVKISDSLGQEGPDSSTTVVTYNDAKYGNVGKRIALTSNFAKRGANPGTALTWPIILNGGVGPYALSIDWGDGKAPTLMSKEFAGNVDVSHVYDSAGLYNIIIKATDKNGDTAFLQLVGIANGAITDNASSQATTNNGNAQNKPLPVLAISAVVIIIALLSFWLGNRYALQRLRHRLEREK